MGLVSSSTSNSSKNIRGGNGKFDFSSYDEFNSWPIQKMTLMISPLQYRQMHMQNSQKVCSVSKGLVFFSTLTTLNLMFVPVLNVISASTTAASIATLSISEYINKQVTQRMFHHQIYLESKSGRFRTIINFNEDGLEMIDSYVQIKMEFKRHEGVNCQLADLKFREGLTWMDIRSELEKVEEKNYCILGWNCQEYSKTLAEAVKQEPAKGEVPHSACEQVETPKTL